MKSKSQAPHRDLYGRRLYSRRVKKCVLAISIVVIALIALIALAASALIRLCAVDRLTFIRRMMHSTLPEWLKAFLWGLN